MLNFSKPSSVHRSTVKVGFAYRHPPRQVARVLIAALRGMPEILDDPAPDCLPIEFGDSAILYALRYWTDNVQRDVIVEGEVRLRIWYAAQRAGLEIPFPVRTIHTIPAAAASAAAGDDEREHQDRLEALARVDLFARLDAAELELLVGDMKSQSFAAGELVIAQGDVGDSLYVIHRGEVAVGVAVDGDAREVALLKEGNFFGEMSLLTGEPRTATCRAHSDVDCWVIDHEAMRRLLRKKPKIAEDMSSMLAARQVALDDKRTIAAARADVRPQEQRLLDRIRSFFSL